MDRETEITDKLLQLMRVQKINHNLESECIKLRHEVGNLEERDNGRLIEDLRKENSDLRGELYKLKGRVQLMDNIVYLYEAERYFDFKKPRLSKVCRELNMDMQDAVDVLAQTGLIEWSRRETFCKPNTKLDMMQYCVLRFMEHKNK